MIFHNHIKHNDNDSNKSFIPGESLVVISLKLARENINSTKNFIIY